MVRRVPVGCKRPLGCLCTTWCDQLQKTTGKWVYKLKTNLAIIYIMYNFAMEESRRLNWEKNDSPNSISLFNRLWTVPECILRCPHAAYCLYLHFALGMNCIVYTIATLLLFIINKRIYIYIIRIYETIGKRDTIQISILLTKRYGTWIRYWYQYF